MIDLRAPGNILVVDDTPTNLTVLRKLLGADGHRVYPVLNGETALKVVSKNPPDLILLDIMMPGMDGYEVCRRLKENGLTRDIPVIFLTALSQSEDVVRGFAAGGVDYVIKPFNSDELLMRIATHLELKRRRDMTLSLNQRLIEEIETRRRAEVALERERNMVRRFLDTAGALIMLLSPDGRVNMVNRRGLEMLGRSENDLLERDFFDACVVEADRERFRALLRDMVANGGPPPEHFETRVVTPHQGERIFFWRHHPAPDNIGLIASAVDITEIRRAEAERLSGEKLQGVMEMAGAVCHELNQPLQNIVGVSELLRMKHGDENPDLSRKLDIVVEQVDRIKDLTGRLQNVTRYAAKDYVQNIRIIDLAKASGDGGPPSPSLRRPIRDPPPHNS